MDISENEKVEFFLRPRGIEPVTSGFLLRAKSSSEQCGVRTRDLAQDGDERNHQTKRLTKKKKGLLPVRGLNNLKTDGRNRCIPCHADVEEDLVGRVATPATKTTFYWVYFPYFP